MAYQQRQRDDSDNNCKCFVGNLNWETDSRELGDFFSQFGPVTDAVVITDRETGRSRGFGFVTFQDSNSKDAALYTNEGRHEIGGRTKWLFQREEKKILQL